MNDQLLARPDPPHTDQVPSFFQKYALILYFVLTLLISWAFWFIEPSPRTKDAVTATFLIQLGSYGPILAAMLLAAVSDSERVHTPLWCRLLAAGLALAAGVYSNWLLAEYILEDASQPIHLFLLGLLTLLPAWVFYNTASSRRGLRDLLGSLVRWRINPLWILVAFLLMPALNAVGALLTSLIAGRPISLWIASIETSPVLRNFALTFFATALYGGPLGEEAGWRRFALPRLQKRFDPLLSSVFLGLIWGFWHLPLHVTGYYSEIYGNPWSGLLLQIFSTIPLAVLFTWLYNRTHGNLLVMVILHTMVNVSSALIAPEIGMYITVMIAVVLMVIFDRMYKMPDAGLSA